MLRGPDLAQFLREMYGNEPARWDPALTGSARLRFTINVLTRLRFCTLDGEMDFKTKDGAGAAPEGFMPWFEVPGRKTADTPIAFGHWSTLGLLEPADAAGPGHRLRLGRQADGGPRGRHGARDHPGAVRAGAEAGAVS